MRNHFESGMNTIHKEEMNKTPEDFLKPAFKALGSPSKALKKPSVELVGPSFSVSSWQDPSLRSSFSDEKPVDEWNQKDHVHYFGRAYRNKYGNILAGHGICKGFYLSLSKVQHALRTQLNITTNCPPVVYKEYVDFFYLRFADSILQKGHQIRFTDLMMQKYIGPFVQQYRFAPSPTKEVLKVEDILTTDLKNDMDSAYGVHAQYFLTNFGVILFANYLIAVVGKSVSDANRFVEKAYEKMRPADRKAVDKATRSYAPYPKWLTVKTFLDQQIEVCDNKPEYDFLKEHKRI